eukprot:1833054-Karenia_brevis.AAC.1
MQFDIEPQHDSVKHGNEDGAQFDHAHRCGVTSGVQLNDASGDGITLAAHASDYDSGDDTDGEVA